MINGYNVFFFFKLVPGVSLNFIFLKFMMVIMDGPLVAGCSSAHKAHHVGRLWANNNNNKKHVTHLLSPHTGFLLMWVRLQLTQVFIFLRSLLVVIDGRQWRW